MTTKERLNEQYPANPVDKLIEEMAELTQAFLKARKFGLHTCHPQTGIFNDTAITKEIEDVRSALEAAIDHITFIDLHGGKI